MSTGGLLPHKDSLCSIEGPSVFTISKRTRINLVTKDFGQAYAQSEQVMTIMNNYVTRPSELLFLT